MVLQIWENFLISERVLNLGRKGGNEMEKKKRRVEKKEDKKKFVEPELIKHEEKLDEVTMQENGTPNMGEFSN